MASVVVALATAGCQSIQGESPSRIQNRDLVASRSPAIPANAMDPLALNWHVETFDLGEHRYAIALTKKRYTTGGDGEAVRLFRRQAEIIAREQGYAGFEVLEYGEGIESRMPIAQRVSRGVVQFTGAPILPSPSGRGDGGEGTGIQSQR